MQGSKVQYKSGNMKKQIDLNIVGYLSVDKIRKNSLATDSIKKI